jgi:two-component system chemotaxis sensor kinase CheA
MVPPRRDRRKRADAHALFVDDSPFRNCSCRCSGRRLRRDRLARGRALALLNGQVRRIISDIEMPGMNGFELAEAIRADARNANVPIIALSSITSPATIERGRQAGFHDFVAKFDRQGLIAALKETTVDFVEAA